MSIKNLRYWVFTSGENGIHGLDWGIKHASEYFADRQQLDTDYRALLKDFGLPPSLERPAEEVGLIFLRWKGEDFIAGFIFSGTDHGDRPNTSSVICVIPSELVGRKSVNELIRDIWTKNNIAEIARKNSQGRPDTLRLEGVRVFSEDVPYFKSSVSWPDYYNGWLQIDSKQRELSRVNAVKAPVTQMEIKPSSRGKLKIVVALAAVAMTFSAVKYFVSWNSENNAEIPKQEELREKLTQFLSGNVTVKPIVKGEKTITMQLQQWDEEKERLFEEIKSQINRISLKPKKPKSKDINVVVKFSFSAPVSVDIGKVIDAILSQYKEDNQS